MSSLKGKTALVTGSTSGIGLGMAIALAKQGVNIMVKISFSKLKNVLDHWTY